MLRARELRSNPSISEQVMWKCLRERRLGFRFNRQVPMGPYFLDFYCAEAKLCVEIDGEQHQERIPHDQRRDDYLAQAGILTLRIPSQNLFAKFGNVDPQILHRIQIACQERTPNP